MERQCDLEHPEASLWWLVISKLIQKCFVESEIVQQYTVTSNIVLRSSNRQSLRIVKTQS